jgi:superfamily II DNA or RNA helicase
MSKKIRVQNQAAPRGYKQSVIKPFTRHWEEYHDWQREACEMLFGARFGVIEAPTGAGKSLPMMTLGAKHAAAGGKVLIVTPTNEISAGYDPPHRFEGLPGGTLEWEPELVEDGKLARLEEFLRGRKPGVIIATHACLARLLPAIEARPSLLRGVLIEIDEAHHPRDDDGDGDFNRLGRLVRIATAGAEKFDTRVILVSATMFRGDRYPIVGTEHWPLYKQATFKRSIEDHMRYTGIKKVHYHLVTYAGRDDSYPAALQDLYAKFTRFDTNKGIVYMPHTGSRYIRGQKESHIQRIQAALATAGRTTLDMVSATTQDAAQAEFVERRRGNKELDHDTILAMNLMQEGADWPAADHVVIIGHRGSMPKNYQMPGRALRAYPGKKNVHVFLVLRRGGITSEDSYEFNRYLKAVHTAMIGEAVFQVREAREGGTERDYSGRETPPSGAASDWYETLESYQDVVLEAQTATLKAMKLDAIKTINLATTDVELYQELLVTKSAAIADKKGLDPERAKEFALAWGLRLLKAGLEYFSDDLATHLVQSSTAGTHTGVPISIAALKQFRRLVDNDSAQAEAALSKLLDYCRRNGRPTTKRATTQEQKDMERYFGRFNASSDPWYDPTVRQKCIDAAIQGVTRRRREDKTERRLAA